MTISLDKVFGIHAKALTFRAERAEVLAHNLANAETPGYKAKDIDFATALEGSNAGYKVDATHNKHLGASSDYSASTTYRTNLQPRFDGNTVDTQVEYAEYTKNALQYQTSLNFLSGSIKSILTAIKGQ